MQIFLQAETNEDLERIIRYNIGKAHQIRKELKILKELPQMTKNPIKEDEVTPVLIDEEYEEKEINEEYLYYYINLLDDIKEAKTEEEKKLIVSSNLPTIDNKNYSNIVNRIKLELLKEISDLEELKRLEDEPIYITEIENEILELKTLIKLITEVQTEKIEVQSSSKKPVKNTLIFLQTHTGSTYAENDLYSIPEEYYESFKELILSIENGTFKNVKQFVRNNIILKGISEVKDFKTRVVFHRLNASTYVIIDIFVKKSMRDNGYVESLKNRVEYYKRNKSVIIESIKDESYLQYHQELRDNLIKGLTERNIIKTMKRG